MPLIELDFDSLTDWVKEMVVRYGDNLLAVVFVLIFIFAGIQRLGRGGA